MRKLLVFPALLALSACQRDVPREPIPPPVAKKAAPTTTKPVTRDATGLPDDPALPLVRKHCLACHDVQPLLAAGGDAAYWRAVTERMQKERQMWPVPEDELKQVLTYLETHFATARKSAADPGPPAPDDGVDPRIHRARQALASLKTPLMKALAAGMRQGPAQAVEACNTEAPGIAERASAAGVKVGRASPKPRNPSNTAPAWAAPIMKELEGSKPAQVVYKTVELDGGGLGYVEPIYVQPLCLTCHGDEKKDIPPEVVNTLKAKYPKDQARGYAVGAYRGIFWAEVPGAMNTP